MNTYLDGRREPPRAAVALPRVRDRHRARDGRSDGPALLPPDRQRRRVHDPRDRESDRPRVDPSPRGLIYDRAGRPLVTNVPTFAVKLRPADLPLEFRPEVVDRLAALLRMDPAGHQRGDRQQSRARRSTSCGSPTTSTRTRPGSSPSRRRSCPASRSWSRPDASTPTGPLMSQILGYTGPVSAEQLDGPQGPGLPARRPARQGRRRVLVRDRPARRLRHRAGRAQRPRPEDAGPRDR